MRDALLLVGLGNPGPQYERSRHNIGFQALQLIANRRGLGPWRARFEGICAQGRLDTGDDTVALLMLQPATFYNDSGRSVARAANYLKILPGRIIVIHDDVDLAPGRVRVKQGGGDAGNRGMRSVAQHVGADVRRVRIGIGHPGEKDAVRNHVLADFVGSEASRRDATLAAIDDALPLLLRGEDKKFQNEVMRLAPISDGNRGARDGV